MPADFPLTVESNTPLGGAFHLLTMNASVDLPAWKPGQFAMLSLGGRQDPLLRRPFSLYNLFNPARPKRAQFLCKILGRGSGMLANAGPGTTLPCLMPLGRGFEPDRREGDRLVLVAGGVGVASLHPLAEAEIRRGGSPLLLYGCRTAAETGASEPTRALGVETLISTDDGSAGEKGFVSSLLDSYLRANGGSGAVVCVCGPTPMMKASAETASRHEARCWLSLEATMACGFGVCVGCVVRVRRGEGEETSYRRTCIDGPVMPAGGIVW